MQLTKLLLIGLGFATSAMAACQTNAVRFILNPYCLRHLTSLSPLPSFPSPLLHFPTPFIISHPHPLFTLPLVFRTDAIQSRRTAAPLSKAAPDWYAWAAVPLRPRGIVFLSMSAVKLKVARVVNLPLWFWGWGEGMRMRVEGWGSSGLSGYVKSC